MTPEREDKFKKVLSHRQPDLTVVLENVHDPHNIAAVLRSCDAVGIQDVYEINTTDKEREISKTTSAGANKWVDVHRFSDVKTCLTVVKDRYKRIFATHLSEDATGLYELDLTEPIALLFGNEHSGLSDEILSYADGNFIIPQMGMIQSLNISVACAVSVYEASRQRHAKGLYNSSRMSETEYTRLFKEWEQSQIFWRRRFKED